MDVATIVREMKSGSAKLIKADIEKGDAKAMSLAMQVLREYQRLCAFEDDEYQRLLFTKAYVKWKTATRGDGEDLAVRCATISRPSAHPRKSGGRGKNGLPNGRNC
ncbi:hypothetical protein ACP26L_36530 (plasmid) [Paenibacillus sp. S-38]|uniref:hypothetical protein n=1 Tax=Paenibacillus sp. S-38 TaxID=3416710 RepID=UPI003CF46C78